MNGDDRNQVGFVFCIEVVKIGLVLKIIGIQIAGIQCQIGLDIVGKLFDLQLISLFCQNFLDNCQNLGMGCDAGADHNFSGLGSIL